jgi:hypothetical protein
MYCLQLSFEWVLVHHRVRLRVRSLDFGMLNLQLRLHAPYVNLSRHHIPLQIKRPVIMTTFFNRLWHRPSSVSHSQMIWCKSLEAFVCTTSLPTTCYHATLNVPITTNHNDYQIICIKRLTSRKKEARNVKNTHNPIVDVASIHVSSKRRTFGKRAVDTG